MEPQGHGEYPIRKRTLPEQCRYWEQKMLELVKTDQTNRSVILGVALFLGELSEKLPEDDD